MKLLLDENIPNIIIDYFKTLHLDLKTTQDLSLIQAPDSEIVRRANKTKRTIVTRDLGIIASYPDATRYGLILIRYKGVVPQVLLTTLSVFISSWKKKSLKDRFIMVTQEKYEVFKE